MPTPDAQEPCSARSAAAVSLANLQHRSQKDLGAYLVPQKERTAACPRGLWGTKDARQGSSQQAKTLGCHMAGGHRDTKVGESTRPEAAFVGLWALASVHMGCLRGARGPCELSHHQRAPRTGLAAPSRRLCPRGDPFGDPQSQVTSPCNSPPYAKGPMWPYRGSTGWLHASPFSE